jgi:hypothetical protein
MICFIKWSPRGFFFLSSNKHRNSSSSSRLFSVHTLLHGVVIHVPFTLQPSSALLSSVSLSAPLDGDGGGDGGTFPPRSSNPHTLIMPSHHHIPFSPSNHTTL